MLGNLKLLLVLALGLMLELSIAARAAQEITAIIDDEDAAVVAEVTDVIPPRGRKIGFRNKNGEMAAIVTARESRTRSTKGYSATFSPTAGTSGIVGSWGDAMSTRFSAGLMLDVPLSEKFSAEFEGLYTKHDIQYAMPTRSNQIQRHDIDTLSFGANGKYYFTRKLFSPYVGIGIAGLCYQNLSMGAANPSGRYNEWIGAGQLLAGIDFNVSSKVSFGVRGSGVMPLFSRPDIPGSGVASLPGYEEAAAVDSILYRALGTVRFAL